MRLCDVKYLKKFLKMIINKDTSPQRDVYYLGAKTIEIIEKMPGKKVDFFNTLYTIIKFLIC
jgi:hypothetical protein